MKKKILVMVVAFIFCMSFTGCGKKESVKELAKNDIAQENSERNSMRTDTDTQTSIPENDTEIVKKNDAKVVEKNESEVVEEDLPDGFKQLSDAELKSVPDLDNLIEVESSIEHEIGVNEIITSIYGNYQENASSALIEDYIVTDTDKRIVVSMLYSEIDSVKQWSTYKIMDVDTGKYYFMEEKFRDQYEIYDYKTGEKIADDTNSQEDIEVAEEIEHRDGMYGISDKDIHDVDGAFSANKVRNDTTGNWRISTIAANINIEEYALSYYKWEFHSDDEVHGIVNFNYKTTTCITTDGNILYVDVHEYVDGEEHDANLLFSGMLLKQYFVYLDNGDIEEIQ